MLLANARSIFFYPKKPQPQKSLGPKAAQSLRRARRKERQNHF